MASAVCDLWIHLWIQSGPHLKWPHAIMLSCSSPYHMEWVVSDRVLLVIGCYHAPRAPLVFPKSTSSCVAHTPWAPRLATTNCSTHLRSGAPVTVYGL